MIQYYYNSIFSTRAVVVNTEQLVISGSSAEDPEFEAADHHRPKNGLLNS